MSILRSYHDGQPEYAIIRSSVAANYRRRHQAAPDPRPDEFWCHVGPETPVPGEACIGLCWGDRGPLFSEHYLPGGKACPDDCRRGLVEVGQLSSFVRGGGARLLGHTIMELAQRNSRYVLMTATTQIRAIVSGFGVGFEVLGPALQGRCRDDHIDWGTYYQNDPHVLIIDLQPLTRSLHYSLSRETPGSGLHPGALARCAAPYTGPSHAVSY